MRHAFAATLAMSLVVVSPRPSVAQGRGSVEGFGALSINEFSAARSGFGGRVSVDLVPGVQAIGEVGRIGNVLPDVASTILSFTPFDVRASAFYGEGGVRFFAAPRSPVNPYVEATAGIARLDVGIGGLGPTATPIVGTALRFLDRTGPIAGGGGGIMFRGGPLLLDLGYRYKQVFPNALTETLLGAGRPLRSHQARIGVGVRF